MSITEIVIVLAVALILLGPERMPQIVQGAGKLLRELRLASNTLLRELADSVEEEPHPIEEVHQIEEPHQIERTQENPDTPADPGHGSGNADA